MFLIFLPYIIVSLSELPFILASKPNADIFFWNREFYVCSVFWFFLMDKQFT